jgi:hypothetical protein
VLLITPAFLGVLTTSDTRTSTACKNTARFSCRPSILCFCVAVRLDSDCIRGGLSETSCSWKDEGRPAFSPSKVSASRYAGVARALAYDPTPTNLQTAAVSAIWHIFGA